MADTDVDDDEEEVPLPDKGMKKKILMYLIPAIILIGIVVGVIVVFFMKVKNSDDASYSVITQKDSSGANKTTVFYTLPEFSVKLRTSGDVFETVRIKLNLELNSVEDISTVDSMMPRLNDIIVAHLVELTPEEVSGVEGFYALKTELLNRINLMISPVQVSNLNIKDLNIQITDDLNKEED